VSSFKHQQHAKSKSGDANAPTSGMAGMRKSADNLKRKNNPKRQNQSEDQIETEFSK